MTPIRKGSNPVKIPFAIKSTDKTFAAWANETRTAIRQLEARMPTANVGRGPAAGNKPPFWCAISRVPQSDPAEYQVTVTLGYLAYQSNTPAAQASELGTTGWIVPTIGGVSMERGEEKPPTNPAALATFKADLKKLKVALPANESWVYLRVKTDTDGFPKPFSQEDGSFVTIEAFNQEQKSIHHIRLSPESDEEEGDYFFLILKTKADESDPPKPIAERRITGNREMPNQLIEILNLGEESEAGRQEVYKGYDIAIDKHDLRAVLQQQTPGVPIIEPLAPEVPAVPPVVVDGQIVTPGTPAIPPEEPGDYIRWRTLDGRASYSESSNINTSRQIEVREREEDNEQLPGQKKKIIEVVGNDYTTSESSVRTFSLEINDGLVTNFLKEEDDTGKNLNLTIRQLEYNNDGVIVEPSVELFTILYFRNGLYVGDVDPGDAPVQLDEHSVTHLTSTV